MESTTAHVSEPDPKRNQERNQNGSKTEPEQKPKRNRNTTKNGPKPQDKGAQNGPKTKPKTPNDPKTDPQRAQDGRGLNFLKTHVSKPLVFSDETRVPTDPELT